MSNAPNLAPAPAENEEANSYGDNRSKNCQRRRTVVGDAGGDERSSGGSTHRSTLLLHESCASPSGKRGGQPQLL